MTQHIELGIKKCDINGMQSLEATEKNVASSSKTSDKLAVKISIEVISGEVRCWALFLSMLKLPVLPTPL
jgi:hypothetical protein